MTKAQFKAGINNELKETEFSNRVTKVGSFGVNTILFFDSLCYGVVKWLNNRFAYGISIPEGTTTVYINTPLCKKVNID